MHMMHASFTTTGKKKTKQKFKSAAHAARARESAESWNRLLEKWDVKQTHKKSDYRKPTDVRVMRAGSDLSHIGSVDSGIGIAVKKPIQQYTGDAMIGIGQLHKSNAIPVFSQEDAIDISKMRRG
jgi:hypothetical protein